MEYTIIRSNRNGVSFVIPVINDWFKEKGSTATYTFRVRDTEDIASTVRSIEKRWTRALNEYDSLRAKNLSSKEEADRVQKAFASLDG